MSVETAELLGYTRRWCWLRLPYKNADIILTMPVKILTRGYKSAKLIEIEIDWTSLHRSVHYTADVELLNVVSTRKASIVMDSA